MATDLRVNVLPAPTRSVVRVFQRSRGEVRVLAPSSARVVQVARPVSGATVAAAIAAVSALIDALGIDAIDGLRAALDDKLPRVTLECAGDPDEIDIPAGTSRVVKDTTSGRLSLWANDGGTMIDLLTFTPA